MSPSAVAAVSRPSAIQPVSVARPMMGGSVAVQLIDDQDAVALEAVATRILGRIEAWAARLTRFTATSELSRLNVSPLARVPVGPTMTSVLDWARGVEGLTGGLVDVALLDARLEAETGARPEGPIPATRRWWLERTARGASVRREPGLRFDLDGVAKGWLADRAADLAPARSVLVDADGDIAARLSPGDAWAIGIADPRNADARLGVLELTASDNGEPRCFGVATSGTSIHRWERRDGVAHHLIDPWTSRPAATDVVQATVLAASARAAEAFAKVAVIVGSERAFRELDRPDVLGVLLLTDAGQVRASGGMLRWLA